MVCYQKSVKHDVRGWPKLNKVSSRRPVRSISICGLIDLEIGYNSPHEVLRITERMPDNIGELSPEIPVVDW